MTNITIKCHTLNITDDNFFQLCQDNRNLRFERNANGDLVIMSPSGGETGNRNAIIIQKLGIWTEKDGTGIFFDSSTGFKLPNGADRSPDASWLTLEKWNSLTEEQRQTFIPLSPDFVIELRSKTDSLDTLQKKMKEYLENGTQLGWLINRKDRQVEIYRRGKEVEVLDDPSTLSGENFLKDFVLDLDVVW